MVTGKWSSECSVELGVGSNLAAQPVGAANCISCPMAGSSGPRDFANSALKHLTMDVFPVPADPMISKRPWWLGLERFIRMRNNKYSTASRCWVSKAFRGSAVSTLSSSSGPSCGLQLSADQL